MLKGGFQVSPACPSERNSVESKTLEWSELGLEIRTAELLFVL